MTMTKTMRSVLAASLSLSCAIAAAAAQGVFIAAPPANATFAPGDRFVVDVSKHNSLSGSQDVSLAIGLQPCTPSGAGTCAPDPSGALGTVLFAGPYAPQEVHDGGSIVLAQNYTVVVPEGFAEGPALLSVAHFSLVGALFIPSLDVPSETIFIRAP